MKIPDSAFREFVSKQTFALLFHSSTLSLYESSPSILLRADFRIVRESNGFR